MADFEGKYKLLGAENSFFTMKARAYMRYKKVPMVEVEATPQVRQSIIGPRTGQQFIPVLITPDDATVIQDTSDIIDFIESKHPNPPLYDLDRKEFPLRAWANHMIEAWSDEFMVPYAMSFRWTRKDQRNHIYYEFGRLALSGQPLPGPGRLDKYLEVGGKMGDSFSAGSLFGQGISTMGADAVESHFVKQILTPLSHHLTGTPYLLGNYPSLGDFSMNGGLYGHIYRDPASSGMLKLQAPPVADWIERVAGLAPARSEPVRIIGADPSSSKSGKLTYLYSTPPPLGDDTIPPTITFLFRLIFTEFVPHLLDVCRIVREAVGKMSEAEKKKPLKRTIGGVDFFLTSDDPTKPYKGNRRVYPYAIWMAQRPIDVYYSLPAESKAKIDAFIASDCGPGASEKWDALRKAVATIRVKRQNNQVYVDWDRIAAGSKL